MTFGEALRQLLSITRLKSVNLALFLGYDVSYISRWKSGAKLPSLKNNDFLLHRIAEFFCQSADASGKQRIIEYFELDAQQENPEALTECLSRLLSSVYQNEQFPPQTDDLKAEIGCIYATAVDRERIKQLLVKSTLEAADRSPDMCARVILTSPIRSDRGLNLRQLSKDLAPRLKPHQSVYVRRILNRSDFRHNTADYCRVICSEIGFNDRISCDLFFDDHSENWRSCCALVDNGAYLTEHSNPFTGGQDMICLPCCAETQSFFDQADSFLKNTKPVFFRYVADVLENDLYFINYLSMTNLRSLNVMMPPVFMSDHMLNTLGEEHLSHLTHKDRLISWNHRFFAIPRTVVVYKSALMNYIYDGIISVFGKTIRLPRDERVRHLTDLLEYLKLGLVDFSILADANPVISRHELSVTMSLSQETIYTNDQPDELGLFADRYKVFTDLELIHAFNSFFDGLRDLPYPHIISGPKAAEFISNCMELI